MSPSFTQISARPQRCFSRGSRTSGVIPPCLCFVLLCLCSVCAHLTSKSSFTSSSLHRK